MQHNLEGPVHQQSEIPFPSMMAPAREMFEQWISFFPTAPLFGVRWRFAATRSEAGRQITAEVTQEVLAPIDGPDDLTSIKGIGPKLAAELNALGVTSFAQIAAFTAQDLVRIDAALNSIRGRCVREDWVGQAGTLMG